MKELQWKEEYLLGIPGIDIQHKRIFDCFISIAEASIKHDRWLADSSIVQLVSLLREHFAVEESVMQILGYPDLELHIQEHRQFEAEVHDLAQKSLRIKGSVSHDTIKVAQEWLREHIMTSDRHYADCFSGSKRKSIGKKRRVKSRATAPA